MDISSKDSNVNLLERRMVPAHNDKVQLTSSASPQSFSLMTFNLLADSLCHPDAFPMSPPECLRWDYRKDQLLGEIKRFDPDLLCVQECDKYDEWFSPQLSEVGYAGEFKKKANDAPDGAAIFYKKDKFSCVSSTSCQLRGTDAQIGIVMHLAPKSEESGHKHILCGSTHLKATKTAEGEEIRGQQIQYLLERLSEASKALSVPHVVLLAGDFNASPNSPKGYPALAYPCVGQHELGLASAYSSNRGSAVEESAAGEPPFTSFKMRGESHNGGAGGKMMYTIDYIWYSHALLSVQSLLSIPDEETIGPAGLPNLKYPSDHLAVMAEFMVKT